MKAIAYEEFGSADVLELKEVRKPDVGRDEVLVRVRAASPNRWDWHFMRGLPYMPFWLIFKGFKPEVYR